MDKDKIIKLTENSPYIPNLNSILRGAFSVIPFVGGALDHLIFDKSGEIRLKNIEKTLDDLNSKIKLFDENKISKNWFESTECIQMFSLLIEKSQFEPDENKINNLSLIFAKSGLKEFENDPNKFAVLTKVAEMTFVQQNILQIINEIRPTQKNSTSSGSIQYTATAIWISDILKDLQNKASVGKQFWKGNIPLDTELEILETFNLIKSFPLGTTDEAGYSITALGKLIIIYLSNPTSK